MSEKNSAAAPGGFSLFCCHILENEYLNNGYTMLFGSFGARPDIKANIPSFCIKNGCFSKVAN